MWVTARVTRSRSVSTGIQYKIYLNMNGLFGDSETLLGNDGNQGREDNAGMTGTLLLARDGITDLSGG